VIGQLVTFFCQMSFFSSNHWLRFLIVKLGILIECSQYLCVNILWDTEKTVPPDANTEGSSIHMLMLNYAVVSYFKCDFLLFGCPCWQRKYWRCDVQAALLALERGWSMNLGGGFHHCSSDRGGGFCAYADITLAVRIVRQQYPEINKVMIIDLDASQVHSLLH